MRVACIIALNDVDEFFLLSTDFVYVHDYINSSVKLSLLTHLFITINCNMFFCVHGGIKVNIGVHTLRLYVHKGKQIKLIIN